MYHLGSACGSSLRPSTDHSISMGLSPRAGQRRTAVWPRRTTTRPIFSGKCAGAVSVARKVVLRFGYESEGCVMVMIMGCLSQV